MTDILLVEDNLELAELIGVFLKKDGYTVEHTESGEEALEFLEREQVKLFILDINLPGMDGFAVCHRVRALGNTPIIILSARVGKSDKLTGFQLGADDYVEKPVDPDILSAKVGALLQRTYSMEKENDILISGQLSIDRSARKVYISGNQVELNAKEYELILLLAENPGKTLSKEFLFNEIWGYDSFSENQTLTVHIKMLRTKIEADPKNPKRILTVWGVGYRYEEI